MSRLKVHGRLKEVCDNVYFQPTEETKLKYPCIIYEVDSYVNLFANNRFYTKIPQYRTTVIAREPDSKLNNELMDEFDPSINFDTKYTSDNLYHTVWIISDNTGSEDPK